MTASLRRDCRCPRARHQHGSVGAYHRDRCRCLQCRLAKHYALQSYAAGETWSETGDDYVPKIATARRLQGLMALGYTARELTAHTGLTEAHLQNLRNGPNPSVTIRIADAVAEAYDRLWDKPATGLQASRQRGKARTLGYVVPIAWDDDELDDPAARPRIPGSGGAWDLRPCGTPAAARRHYRRGEALDEACRAAMRRQSNERRSAA